MRWIVGAVTAGALCGCVAPARPPTPSLADFSECTLMDGVISARPFPRRMIGLAVAQASADPLNTYVSSALGRCKGNTIDNAYFCVTTIRRNAAGYNSNPELYFGEWGTPPNVFRVTARGDRAAELCRQHVHRTPAPATPPQPATTPRPREPEPEPEQDI